MTGRGNVKSEGKSMAPGACRGQIICLSIISSSAAKKLGSLNWQLCASLRRLAPERDK